MKLIWVYARFQSLIRLVAMTALLGLVGITALDVFGRVIFNKSLGFTYELIGILLGSTVYSGLIILNWRRDHICIDLFVSFFDKFPIFNHVRDRIVWALEILFFTILTFYIFRQASVLYKWNKTFLFLPLDKWLPVTMFGVFAAIAALVNISAISLKWRGKLDDL